MTKLANDWIARIAVVFLIASVALYLLPLLSESSLESFAEFYAYAIWLSLILAALIPLARKTDHPEERRFWRLLILSFAAWLVGLGLFELTIYELGAWSSWAYVVGDGLYFISLFSFVLATEQNPHLEAGWSKRSAPYSFSTLGSFIFCIALLLYFFIIPSSMSFETFEYWGPTYYSVIALDFLIAARLFYHFSRSKNSRWKNLYLLLECAMVLWLISDTIDCLIFLGIVEIPLGTALDFLWFAPFMLAFSALRWLRLNGDVAPGSEKYSPQPVPVVAGVLLVYALTMPLAHFALYALNLIDPATHSARVLVVVLVMVICSGLAGLHLWLLDRRNRELSSAVSQLALDEQVQRSQKLEAIGRLAGGVAHDFNNLLMVIQGSTELGLREIPQTSVLRRRMQEILQATHRGGELTRQLLAFGRRQVLEPEVADVNQVVTEAKVLIQRLIGEDIDLRTDLGSSVVSVWADTGQLIQILLNLAINARDAMPEGGALVITTSNVVAGADEAPGLPVEEGVFARVSVWDSGFGMDRSTQQRIFEPFYSGKAGGTGLGLATVYGIVKQTGGFIHVASEPGSGSDFVVYLPQTARTAEGTKPRTELYEPALREPATVLLVEDESSVRKITSEQLQAQGFRVLEASDGDEARLIARHYPGEINLLLTDVVMPGISGPQLARRMARSHPGTKVLYMTGYADVAHCHRRSMQHDAALIQKPFSWTALDLKVQEILKSGV